MITPEMLKPLIDKWEGILEIALDKSTESWCNVIRDTRTGKSTVNKFFHNF
jgi:hypothetical protein